MKSKIVVIGSFNLDYVFRVDRFVLPKETYHSEGMEIHYGGKGFNQSVALAKIFDDVYFAANLNQQDQFILELLKHQNVHSDFIHFVSEPTGMAFIQVNQEGENCILLNKGANHQFTLEQLIDILNHFEEGDVLLLQNEINLLKPLIEMAHARKLKIALNPSPFHTDLNTYPLEYLSYILINEVEGEALTHQKDPDKMLEILSKLYPNCTVVLTLGSQGAKVLSEGKVYAHTGYRVKAIDTTSAGDTFTGYFLSSITQGQTIEEALKMASAAAALSVTKVGAMDSIPSLTDVQEFLKTQKN